MDSVNHAKNIKGTKFDWQYHWSHIVFVTKKRKKNFRKEYNRIVVRTAIEEADTSFEGWFAYAGFANIYTLRNKLMNEYSDLLSESKPKTC
jgi:hypothetical protein